MLRCKANNLRIDDTASQSLLNIVQLITTSHLYS